METKTDKAIKLITSGDWKSALNIIRTFRLDFTKSQKRQIEIASDVLNGHEKFYRGLGIDTQSVVAECKKMVQEKYKVS